MYDFIMTRNLNMWGRVSERVYDVILTSFLAKNLWTFSHEILVHGPITVQNLFLFFFNLSKGKQSYEEEGRNPPPKV